METKIENTVVKNATTNLKKTYSFQNILSLKIPLNLLKGLQNKGVISSEDFNKARIILVEKYNLNSNTIYA